VQYIRNQQIKGGYKDSLYKVEKSEGAIYFIAETEGRTQTG